MSQGHESEKEPRDASDLDLVVAKAFHVAATGFVETLDSDKFK
jgi:hypothetical protein